MPSDQNDRERYRPQQCTDAARTQAALTDVRRRHERRGWSRTTTPRERLGTGTCVHGSGKRGRVLCTVLGSAQAYAPPRDVSPFGAGRRSSSRPAWVAAPAYERRITRIDQYAGELQFFFLSHRSCCPRAPIVRATYAWAPALWRAGSAAVLLLSASWLGGASSTFEQPNRPHQRRAYDFGGASASASAARLTVRWLRTGIGWWAGPTHVEERVLKVLLVPPIQAAHHRRRPLQHADGKRGCATDTSSRQWSVRTAVWPRIAASARPEVRYHGRVCVLVRLRARLND